MTISLITVADASSPPDYTTLPHDVRVMLGYIGESGETPHVWSTQQAEHARKTVGAWAPIWVPPQGRMSKETGQAAAVKALAALPQYGLPKDCPVFFDIERHSYDTDPAGAKDAARGFHDVLHFHGWTRGTPYAPHELGYGWIAWYVGKAPENLPPAWDGQQWTGSDSTHHYDLSVFHADVFAAILPPDEGNDMALDKADKQWILKQLETLEANIVKQIGLLHDGGQGGKDWRRNVATTYDLVAQLHTAQGVTADGILDALAARLKA